MTILYADSDANNQPLPKRVAWLFPSLERGSYWHPLFRSFSQRYPQTTIYTGLWPGFATGFEDGFTVEVVGKTKLFHTTRTDQGYSRSYILPSLEIIPKLLTLRPDVIFTSAFSLWTAIALLCKFFLGSRVIVLFDGVAPGVDYLNSGIRVIPRRMMSWLVDAFITNSHAGKDYLTNVAWAPSARVFVKPYLVPDISALTASQSDPLEIDLDLVPKPVFLCVGQIIPRKGLQFLLQACALLKEQGYDQFTVWVIGEGDERPGLEDLTREKGLEHCIRWLGAVEYDRLGTYFDRADVFVFPTLEDIWGMVVSEAMAFGKPVLCSERAGAIEVMVEGDNGYIFDPYDTEQLSALMRRFIDRPALIETMGAQSKRQAAELTPESAATFFCHLAATT
ncbi:MAG: glycosyltransferase family 4 protein [Phormidesmis sp.]